MMQEPARYVDNAAIAWSRRTVLLKFRFAGTDEDTIQLVIPHAAAKQFAMMLRRELKSYEEKHGEIVLDETEWESAEIVPEDW